MKIQNLTNEIWKPVLGYEGYYEISNMGRLKRLPRISTDSLGRTSYLDERLSIGKQGGTGYRHLSLCKPGCNKITKDFHRMVAEAFIPNPDNLPCVNHKNENRSDNRAENLEWCTYKYNNTYNDAVRKRCQTKRAKKVICQYTLDGNLVNTFENMRAVKNKIGSNVYACVNGYQKQSHGFVWKYEGDKFSYDKKTKRDTSTECHNYDATQFSGMHKAGYSTTHIEQYSMDGTFVTTFTSIVDAAKTVNASASNIVACCQGRQASCKGFRWKYKY